MSTPARAGVFVYARDLPRLAAFYATVLGMRQVHATDEMAILASPDLQLLVHRIPAAIAAGIRIEIPPLPRPLSLPLPVASPPPTPKSPPPLQRQPAASLRSSPAAPASTS